MPAESSLLCKNCGRKLNWALTQQFAFGRKNVPKGSMVIWSPDEGGTERDLYAYVADGTLPGLDSRGKFCSQVCKDEFAKEERS